MKSDHLLSFNLIQWQKVGFLEFLINETNILT